MSGPKEIHIEPGSATGKDLDSINEILDRLHPDKVASIIIPICGTPSRSWVGGVHYDNRRMSEEQASAFLRDALGILEE